jgi:hypothetical protein
LLETLKYSRKQHLSAEDKYLEARVLGASVLVKSPKSYDERDCFQRVVGVERSVHGESCVRCECGDAACAYPPEDWPSGRLYSFDEVWFECSYTFVVFGAPGQPNASVKDGFYSLLEELHSIGELGSDRDAGYSPGYSQSTDCDFLLSVKDSFEAPDDVDGSRAFLCTARGVPEDVIRLRAKLMELYDAPEFVAPVLVGWPTVYGAPNFSGARVCIAGYDVLVTFECAGYFDENDGMGSVRRLNI